MKIRLLRDGEGDPEFICPKHGVAMALEDFDSGYGQAVFLCPVVDCHEQRHTGPSDNDIYLREQGRL